MNTSLNLVSIVQRVSMYVRLPPTTLVLPGWRRAVCCCHLPLCQRRGRVSQQRGEQKCTSDQDRIVSQHDERDLQVSVRRYEISRVSRVKRCRQVIWLNETDETGAFATTIFRGLAHQETLQRWLPPPPSTTLETITIQIT